MAIVTLAIDQIPVTETDRAPLPSGTILGIARSLQELRAAGFRSNPYRSGTSRIATIDDGAAGWDNNVDVGWYYVHSATAADRRVQEVLPLTEAGERKKRVGQDITLFKQTFADKEETDFPKLLAREKVDTVTDSGHSWVDDIIHGWVKPWVRLVESGLATAKALPTQANIDAYTTDLATFIRMANSPGLLGFHAYAIRSEWRPLRDGLAAWEFDTNGSIGDGVYGGILAGSSRTVAYPTGQSVATWSAYAAVGVL